MIARLFRRAARIAEDIGAWLHTAAAIIGPDDREDGR